MYYTVYLQADELLFLPNDSLQDDRMPTANKDHSDGISRPLQ